MKLYDVTLKNGSRYKHLYVEAENEQRAILLTRLHLSTKRNQEWIRSSITAQPMKTIKASDYKYEDVAMLNTVQVILEKGKVSHFDNDEDFREYAWSAGINFDFHNNFMLYNSKLIGMVYPEGQLVDYKQIKHSLGLDPTNKDMIRKQK